MVSKRWWPPPRTTKREEWKGGIPIMDNQIFELCHPQWSFSGQFVATTSGR
jgi:hypothetical protein